MLIKINWLDILMLIGLGRALYVGYKDGLSVEVIRLLKNIATLLLSLHFYQPFGQIISFNSLYSQEIARAVAFFLIVLSLYIIFYFIEKFIKIILQFTFIAGLETYGGMFFGAIRNVFATATIIILTSLIPISFIVKQVNNASYLASFILKQLPAKYDQYGECYFEPKKFEVKEYYAYLDKYSKSTGKKKSSSEKSSKGMNLF